MFVDLVTHVHISVSNEILAIYLCMVKHHKIISNTIEQFLRLKHLMTYPECKFCL